MTAPGLLSQKTPLPPFKRRLAGGGTGGKGVAKKKKNRYLLPTNRQGNHGHIASGGPGERVPKEESKNRRKQAGLQLEDRTRGPVAGEGTGKLHGRIAWPRGTVQEEGDETKAIREDRISGLICFLSESGGPMNDEKSERKKKCCPCQPRRRPHGGKI